jgi:acryloyl-coenzyme A reductase
MRAAVVHETGGPSVLRLEDVARPQPGPTQVLIEVAACGICGHDQADRMGLTKIPLPEILGHEVAGTVVEVGDQVRHFAVGDRVAAKQFTTCGHCPACLSGRELECKSKTFNYGGYAEYVAVEDSALLTVPDGLDLADSTVVACAVGTCLQALRRIARLQAGEVCLVTGAGGGLGIHGLQVAAAMGAVAVAVTSSPEKEKQLLALGAAHVVVTDRPDYWRQILEITDGRGAEVVLDNVGHPSLFSGCFRGLARGGRYVFTGQVTGERVSFFPAFVFAKEAVITGSASTSMATFVDAMQMVADGRVKAVVESFPLDEVVAAATAGDERRVVGRAVLVP